MLDDHQLLRLEGGPCQGWAVPMPDEPSPSAPKCVEIRQPFTWLYREVARRFAGAPDQPLPIVEAVAVYRVRTLLHASGRWYRTATVSHVKDR